MTIMYCWRTGVVGFTDGKMPDGAIIISNSKKYIPRKYMANGGLNRDPMAWRDHMEAGCRLAYDHETLLVPGVPEADNDEEALDAVLRFIQWISPAECLDYNQGTRRHKKSA